MLQETDAVEKIPLLGMTPDELKAVATEVGAPAFAARQLARWIYAKGVADIDAMTDLSRSVRERLSARYTVGQALPLSHQRSVDGTVKYLFPTRSGRCVETVFIPDGDRGTACVSCQVGCKMSCRFCMTGRQGFQGNLSVTDILNQLYALPERERLTNIVFMGQGEPLDNLDAVLRTTELLMADYGWAWSPRRITVSTVGLRKGLRRFLDESPCHLAISLHNPFHEERAALMPAERSYPLSEMLSLLREYDWTGQRRLSFEYIVLGGQTDTPRHARELVRLLGQMECRVNLIRWHELPGDDSLHSPSPASVEHLRDYLCRHGLRCTIRASRGQDIDAACGLLNTASQMPRPLTCVPEEEGSRGEGDEEREKQQ